MVLHLALCVVYILLKWMSFIFIFYIPQFFFSNFFSFFFISLINEYINIKKSLFSVYTFLDFSV